MIHEDNRTSDAPTTMAARILILGGTAFVGRAVATVALAAGHAVTLFNRGKTNPDLFLEAERLRGDRTSDVSALATGRWDAVIDVATYHPAVVQRSIDVLAERVRRYVFVSTLSVYVDHSTTDSQREGAPLLDVASVTHDADLYGARKAACEGAVLSALPSRSTVARVGMIVGPHDPTSRFVYWPRRIAAGGQVLAPGSPQDPVQFIDVRDLAAWLLRAAVTDLPGIFNVTGSPLPIGALLEACRVPGVHAELIWTPSHRLLDAGLDPWMGVPLWIAAPGWEAASLVDITRATEAGLTHRPLVETIEGAVHAAGDDGKTPLSEAAESRLLAHLNDPAQRPTGGAL